MADTKPTKATPAAKSAAASKSDTGFRSAAEVLDLDPKERPNKALTEGPDGSLDTLTNTLAVAAGGGEEAERAARPLAEAMHERQVNEVPSRAEREARDK